MIALGIMAAVIIVFGIGVITGKTMTDDGSDNLIGSLVIVEVVLLIVTIINVALGVLS